MGLLQKLFFLEVGSADSIPKPKPQKDMQDVIYNPVERTRCGRKVKKPKDYKILLISMQKNGGRML